MKPFPLASAIACALASSPPLWAQQATPIELDEEIRVHASYLKNVAPQMGRSFTLGLRGEI